MQASYACDDGSGSGIASCTGPVPNGDMIDTSTLGPHTFTVTATDREGNTATQTRHYTVIELPGPITFTVDAGATFTPTVPTSNAPVTTLAAEGLTGSYTVQLQASSPYFGSHLYRVTAFHMRTSSGAVFDLPVSSTGQLVCFDTYGRCEPQIPFDATGFPAATQGSVQTTGLAIGQPRWDGSETDPTGFDWSPPNTYVPAGVSVYRTGPTGSLEIVGVLSFHASRGTPDTTPPEVTITSPADGAVVAAGSSLTASYSCADTGGSGLANCAGSVPNGGDARHRDDRRPHAHRHRDRRRGEHEDRAGDVHGHRRGRSAESPSTRRSTAGSTRSVRPSTASYACSDPGGSGVGSCDGSVASGAAIDTSTAGTHTFTVDATDNAGNTATATAMYRVLAGDVSATVTGGETITTDPGGVGASTRRAVQTQIVVPDGVAGTISVTPQPAARHRPGTCCSAGKRVLNGPDAPERRRPVHGDVHGRLE